jgi:hypothetical protein
VYGFLLRHHIQATWLNTCAAARDLRGGGGGGGGRSNSASNSAATATTSTRTRQARDDHDVVSPPAAQPGIEAEKNPSAPLSPADVDVMTCLCPHLVHVTERYAVPHEGPATSLFSDDAGEDFARMGGFFPEGAPRVDERDIVTTAAAAGVAGADTSPTAAAAAAAGGAAAAAAAAARGPTTSSGNGRESFIIEIVDPGRRQTSAVAQELLPAGGLEAAGLGAPVRGTGIGAEHGVTEMGVRNAIQRRERAFRHGLLVAAGLAYERWRERQEQGGDELVVEEEEEPAPPPPLPPFAELLGGGGSSGKKKNKGASATWPAAFPLAALTLEQIIEAVNQHNKAAEEEQQRQRQRDGGGAEGGEGGEGVRIGAALQGLRSPPRPPRPLTLSKKAEPCTSNEPLAVGPFISHLKSLPWYCGQIAHSEPIPARPSRHRAPLTPLSAPTLRALSRVKGITPDRMFLHQAEAIDAVMAGEHVVVSTSTASGKVGLLWRRVEKIWIGITCTDTSDTLHPYLHQPIYVQP